MDIEHRAFPIPLQDCSKIVHACPIPTAARIQSASTSFLVADKRNKAESKQQQQEQQEQEPAPVIAPPAPTGGGCSRPPVKLITGGKVNAQKIPVSLPAIKSFVLPAGWREFRQPAGHIPGLHNHTFQPQEDSEMFLAFTSDGVANVLDDEGAAYIHKLETDTALEQPIEDNAKLRRLVVNEGYAQKRAVFSSAKMVDWNGKIVLECEYTRDQEIYSPLTDASKPIPVEPRKTWCLIYNNSDKVYEVPEPKVIPAYIQFTAPPAEFDKNIEIVKTAMKTLRWNKNWPPRRVQRTRP